MLKDIFKGIGEAILKFFKEWYEQYQAQKERDRLLLAEQKAAEQRGEMEQVKEEKIRDENNSSLSDDAVSDKLRDVRDRIKGRE